MDSLHILDLDGTVINAPSFYKSSYSASLETLIQELRGSSGLRTLEQCRKNYDGKGELALLALDIPAVLWAERLIEISTEAIKPRADVVNAVNSISGRKVIYTGSPRILAERLLEKMGFCLDSFDMIVGWELSEKFPLKWSRTTVVFQMIMRSLGVELSRTCSVGDNWETDLEPFCQLGGKTVEIGEVKKSPSDLWFPDILAYAEYANSDP